LRHYTFLIILFIILSPEVWGSNSLSYSGRLVNPNGSPVSGQAKLRFDLAYTDDLSAILCSKETPNVDLVNGVFHTKIAFDCSPHTLEKVLAETPVGNSIAIRVTDLTPSTPRIYSFQALHSIPYAIMSNFAKQLSIKGTAEGQVLTWNGSIWTAAEPVVPSTGTVKSISATDGLYGGTITESGIIGIQDGGVTAAKLSDMGAGYGQVLKWNGSTWAPDSDDDTLPAAETDPHVLPFARNDITGITPEECDPNQVLHYVSPDQSLRCFNIVEDVIVNGEVNKAPSQNAVFDALAAKQDLITNASDISMKTLRLSNDGTTWIGLKAPDTAGNFYFTLPAGAGAAGQVLRTDGAGNLSWVTPSTGSSDIVDGSIVDADISGSANIAQAKIAGLPTALTSIQTSISNLTTDNVSEGSRLYFTEAKVLGTDLAGLDTTNGTITDADTVLSSIGKLIGNLTAVSTAQSDYVSKIGDTLSGNLQMSGNTVTGLGVPSDDSDAATKKYVDDKNKWVGDNTSIYYNGNVGVGTSSPGSKLSVIGDLSASGKLRLKSDTAFYIDLQAPASLTANLPLIFPATQGSSGNALITDGSGNLSWGTVATTASTVGGDLTGTIANATIDVDAVTSAKILDGTISNNDISPTASIDQTKIKDLTTDLANKQDAFTTTAPVSYNSGTKVLGINPGASNTILGVNAAGTGMEYKALSASAPLVLTHGTGTMGMDLNTVPVTKGGTGLTAFTADRVYVSDGVGSSLMPFSCASTDVFGFSALGKPTCTAFSAINGTFFNQDGNSFGVAAVLGTNDSQQLHFETNGLTRVTITETGELGIGTATPSKKLDVVGDIQVSTGNDICIAGGNCLSTVNDNKQDSITLGSNSQYLRGDLSLGTFASDVTSTVITGFAAGADAVVTNADSMESAIEKLQGQVTATKASIPAVPQNTDGLAEGMLNRYFTEARTIGSPLTGISTATNSDVAPSDSILAAIGKLQAQMNYADTDRTNYVLKAGDTMTGSLGIGGAANASAMLDVQSTTKGFLPPRMTKAQRDAIVSPVTGLVIFNTTSGQIEYFSGGGWTNSNSFIGSRVVMSSVQSGPLSTDIKLDMTGKTFDVGNTYDLATDRFQPTVAGKYLVSLQVHGSGQTVGSHNIAVIRKNGATYENRFTRSTNSGNSHSSVVTLVDLNGTTDYIEPYFNVSSGSADGAVFSASLQAPASSTAGGGGALTSDSVDGSHIQAGAVSSSEIADGTITSGDIAPNTISVSNLDFASNEGINIPQQAANPATGTAGQTYYNTSTNRIMVYDGTNWVELAGGGAGQFGARITRNVGTVYQALEDGFVMVDAVSGNGYYKVLSDENNPPTTEVLNGQAYAEYGARAAATVPIKKGHYWKVVNTYTSNPRAIFWQPITGTFVANDGHSLDSADGSKVDALFVSNSGNIGVGTLSPVAKLHLKGSDGRDMTFSSGSLTQSINFIHNDNGNINARFANINGILQNGGIGQNNGHLSFSTAPIATGNPATIERMRITGSGHVGIGSTSPGDLAGWVPNSASRILEISGDESPSGSSDGILLFTNNRATPALNDQLGAILFGSKNGTHGIHSGIASYLTGAGGVNGFGSDLNFYTKADNAFGHQNRMVITNEGKVGIGTSTPTVKLEVSGGQTKLQQESWKNLTLQNGWVSYGGSFTPPQYYKDSTGRVHLRGLVKNGSIGTEVCIATLPLGYRPDYRHIVAVQSANAIGRLDLDPSGCVVAYNGSNAWFSLDNVSFRAD